MTSKVLSLILFCSCLFAAHAIEVNDAPAIDSLKEELKHETVDTNRYRIYEQLGYDYIHVNSDSSFHYLNLGLHIAKKIKKVDFQINSLVDIANAHGGNDDNKSALKYLKLAEPIAVESDNKKELARINFLYCYFYFELDETEKVKLYAKKTIALATEIKDYQLLSNCYNTIGVIHLTTGETEKGIEYLVKSQKSIEEGGLTPDASVCYNIARAYQELKNTEKAKEYFNKSLVITETTGELYISFKIVQILGKIAIEAKNFPEAKNKLEALRKLAYESHDNHKSEFHFSSAMYYVALDSLDKAIYDYKKSISLFLDQVPEGKRIGNHLGLAKALFKKYEEHPTKLQEAAKNAELAYEYSVNSKKYKSQGSAAGVLFDVYSAQKKYQKGVQFGKIHLQIRDSLFNSERIKAMADVQDKYEAEKRDLKIELLTKESDLREADLAKSKAEESTQRKVSILTATGLLISVLLALFLFRLYRQKKNGVLALEEKNKVILHQKDEKELLLKEIHHRVKNNLQVVSSLLDLQSQNITDESTITAIEDGQSRVKAMALIHQNLYQNEDLSSVSFEDYVGQLIKQIASLFSGTRTVDVELKAEPTFFDIDTAIPLGLILNELITNAYKYAFSGTEMGKLTIRLEKLKAGEYHLTVSDNGKGLPKDFSMNKIHGLCFEFIQVLSGQINAQVTCENLDKGTRINIQVQNIDIDNV